MPCLASLPADEALSYPWRLVNGVWGLLLSFGFLLTAMLVRTARSWRFFDSRTRGLLADYGVPVRGKVWEVGSGGWFGEGRRCVCVLAARPSGGAGVGTTRPGGRCVCWHAHGPCRALGSPIWQRMHRALGAVPPYPLNTHSSKGRLPAVPPAAPLQVLVGEPSAADMAKS